MTSASAERCSQVEMEAIASSDLQRWFFYPFWVSVKKKRCLVFFFGFFPNIFENWICFVHFSSSFWNFKSWIFPCLYGLTVLAPSFSHESHWVWYRPRACKGLPKRIGGRRESKWKPVEIFHCGSLISSDGFLMDLWWISDDLFPDLFSLYRETTLRPFPQVSWRNSVKWFVSKNPKPSNPAPPVNCGFGMKASNGIMFQEPNPFYTKSPTTLGYLRWK